MHEDRLALKDLRSRARFLNYELLEQIGVGGEGVVWSGIDREHDRIVAIKLNELTGLTEQNSKDRMFDRQAERLLALRHPHILPIYDYGLLKETHYLVSPYIPGGSLRDLLMARELAFEDGLRLAAEIAEGLDFLHGQNILHRDLKPSNILLDFRGCSYISDFGLARFISATTQALHTGRGTPPYAPPEQLATKGMTRQSDIFSFGILLFEMFTRHLPWDGERVLGIQQLYASEELPDPCTINPQLPPDLAKVLRRMTDIDPASRPGSAGEAQREICAVFGLDPPALPSDRLTTEAENREIDARELLKRSLVRWDSQGDTAAPQLTNFALVELEHRKAEPAIAAAETQRYFLHSALVFGLDDDYWWARVEDAASKLEVASSLIGTPDDATTARVVGHLLDDSALTSSPAIPSGRIVEALIQAAVRVHDGLLGQQIMRALRKLAPRHDDWQPTALSDELDRALAYLAINDSLQGDQAANLIGQLRSSAALDTIVRKAPQERCIPALLEIQKVAGDLPASISVRTRLTVSAELLLRRFIDRPLSLLAVFLTALLGSALSVAIQNYLIIRIPAYMDAVRISVSLERGLFLGTFFATGILLIRIIVERSGRTKVLPRLVIATMAGGLIFSIGLLSYDILMVQIDLAGVLLPAGCLLAAFGFAQGRRMRTGFLRTLVAAGFVFLALALTWMMHLVLLGTGVYVSPLFSYEYTWSPWQIGGAMLIFSLPISFFGNLSSLD